MSPSRDHADGTAGTVEAAFRESFGRAVATLTRIFGDLDVAEDAVMDAFTIALARWPVEGPPVDPTRWIIRTGRNRGIDRLRRESLGRAVLADAASGREGEARDGDGVTEESLAEDQLRLLFTCCHPSLSVEAQIALTLRLLMGLSTEEVARAFLIEPGALAQRIVRAKRKIRAAAIPYRVPELSELPGRLAVALATCYLVYNAGANRPPGRSSSADGPRATCLRSEALRLARRMAGLLPDHPETSGLLALLLLVESRRPARFDPRGARVLLRHQDRRRWDRGAILEAQELLRRCIAQDRPGPYQLQATIQAVHADASCHGATDWPQIVRIYDHLMCLQPTDIVALNRAIAVAEVEGPDAGMRLVQDLDLDGYHLLHAARAEFARRLGRIGAAREAYGRAIDLAPDEVDREDLRGRLAELG